MCFWVWLHMHNIHKDLYLCMLMCIIFIWFCLFVCLHFFLFKHSLEDLCLRSHFATQVEFLKSVDLPSLWRWLGSLGYSTTRFFMNSQKLGGRYLEEDIVPMWKWVLYWWCVSILDEGSLCTSVTKQHSSWHQNWQGMTAGYASAKTGLKTWTPCQWFVS